MSIAPVPYYTSPDGLWRARGREPLKPGGDDAYLPGWGHPVFQDDFTGDLSKWNVRNNFTTIDTARAMASNVVVEDGKLHLLGTWLDNAPVNSGSAPHGYFTHDTGYIDQRQLVDSANPNPVHFSQRWGRWEIRCQTPTGPNTRGALAAFWLRTDSNPQGRMGEIDIMEAWGGGGPMSSTWTNWVQGSAFTTFHSNTNSAATNGKPYQKSIYRHWQAGVPRNIYAGMHTYAFEYMPDYCAMYVDDITVFHITPSSPDPEAGGTTMAWIWDQDFFGAPLHMRINLHIGPSASFWGLPDPDNREWTTDPLDYAIEYVRVYAPQT